jgi:hypothetical protein
MERIVNENLGTVGVGFGGCFRKNISVREKVNTQKTQYLRGSANNAYIHREKRFSLTLWGKIHNNGLVSHYKMIISRPEPPFSSSSSSLSLFFSFSLLRPKWACSHRSEWAYGFIGPASIFLPLQ